MNHPRWLYRTRLAGLDWSGMTQEQRLLNTPESHGALVREVRQHGMAFVAAAERLSRVLQRAYEGLQARAGGFDDDRPAA